MSFDEHLRLGQYYLEHKLAGRAATEFEAAAGLQPDSAAAYYNLGAALRLWGDPQGAESALRKATRDSSGRTNAQAWRFLRKLLYIS